MQTGLVGKNPQERSPRGTGSTFSRTDIVVHGATQVWAVMLIAVVAAGCGTSTSPTASNGASQASPAPPSSSQAPIGGTYDINGRELAISCEGSGSPTFVIEGGEGMSMSDFTGLRAELATRGTACTYSRAAVSGGTVDGEQVVADLNALLGVAEVPRPVVLVGHSAGGMFVQLHARLYPANVLGVVSMNPVPPWDPWQAEAFPLMNEEERAAETAYFSGDNGESLDYATTSEQLDRAPAPPEVPFHLIISDETQCEGDDLCERVSPASESIMRDVAETWPRGQLAVVQAGHDIFRDDVQAILDAVDDILADMAPGALHGEGGPGLTEFDAFGALVEWVETGQAPEAITASRGAETRPLCPYPTVATYDGTGDRSQATSFHCT